MKKIQDLSNRQKLSSLAVIVFVALASFFAMQAVRANSDYICTIYEDTEGDCTDGTWSDYAVVPESKVVNGCVETEQELRTYTGRRAIEHVIKYFANSRIGCRAGGTHEYLSGLTNRYYNETTGQVATRFQACQIHETVTKRYDNCTTDISTTTTGTTTGTTTDTVVEIVDITTTETNGTEITVSTTTNTESLDRRRARIAAEITAEPRIIRSGDKSKVSWATVEVNGNTCTVTGRIADGTVVGTPWTGGGDEQLTPILTEDTIYTLSCENAVDGGNVENSVTIKVLPIPSEQ